MSTIQDRDFTVSVKPKRIVAVIMYGEEAYETTHRLYAHGARQFHQPYVCAGGSECLIYATQQCPLSMQYVQQCLLVSTNVQQCPVVSSSVHQCRVVSATVSTSVEQCPLVFTSVHYCLVMCSNVQQCPLSTVHWLDFVHFFASSHRPPSDVQSKNSSQKWLNV